MVGDGASAAVGPSPTRAPPAHGVWPALTMNKSRRCSANTRLLVCLGLAVLVLNLCCVYALLSLHGIIHTPLLVPAVLESGRLAARRLTAEPASLSKEIIDSTERDEWDAIEDMLASAESTVSENEAAAELPGTVDLTVHVDVTVVTQVMCRALANALAAHARTAPRPHRRALSVSG